MATYISADLEAKLTQAKTDEEVIQILADAGIKMTIDELEVASNSAELELDETALDNISGGILSAIQNIYYKYIAKNRTSGGGGKGSFGGGGGGGGR